jgi:hypothetical protein
MRISIKTQEKRKTATSFALIRSSVSEAIDLDPEQMYLIYKQNIDIAVVSKGDRP